MREELFAGNASRRVVKGAVVPLVARYDDERAIGDVDILGRVCVVLELLMVSGMIGSGRNRPDARVRHAGVVELVGPE